MKELTIYAPAKINLCLSVLGKRSDGYHEVEMVMQAVGLYDKIRAQLVENGIFVACNAADVPGGEDNIAWRAAHKMSMLAGGRYGVAIDIYKNIPVAAGLGGGSSNAAAVIAACNRLFGLKFSREQLAEIGAGIGMDVPFFFYAPTALARGRGEILTELPPPPKFWVLLVNPGFEISTAWVYKNLNFGLTKKVDCNKIAGLTIGQIAASLHNDLEAVTASAHPVIGQMMQALCEAGALGARMSGSGPTVFGVFETENACRKASDSLGGRGWRIFTAEILTMPLYWTGTEQWS